MFSSQVHHRPFAFSVPPQMQVPLLSRNCHRKLSKRDNPTGGGAERGSGFAGGGEEDGVGAVVFWMRVAVVSWRAAKPAAASWRERVSRSKPKWGMPWLSSWKDPSSVSRSRRATEPPGASRAKKFRRRRRCRRRGGGSWRRRRDRRGRAAGGPWKSRRGGFPHGRRRRPGLFDRGLRACRRRNRRRVTRRTRGARARASRPVPAP
jgi:hypothetical protein